MTAKGTSVLHYDKNLDASAGQPLGASQVLAPPDRPVSAVSPRAAAVARFLAGAEGWEEAAQQLRGAFAQSQADVIDDQPGKVNR